MTDIRNVWWELGFRENPFHTNPLRAIKEDRAVYIARPELENQLGTWIASENRGGTFVEGQVGVGKTSLVHQTNYALRRKHPEILLCNDILEVQNSDDAVGVVLGMIATILRNLVAQSPGTEKAAAFKSLEREVRQSQVQGWNAGVQVLAVGASGGKAPAPTQPHTVTLAALGESLDRMQALLVERRFTKAVVVLNNLDNVRRDHLTSLLHDTRDSLLQRNGLVLVFIGPTGVRTSLAADASHRRIDQVLSGVPVHVGAFSAKETLQIAHTRVEHFARADRSVPPACPVPDTLITLLHNVSGGELRYVLQRITDVVQKVSRETALVGPMDYATAWAALHSIVAQATQHVPLTAKKRAVLQRLAQLGKAQPKDYKRFGLNNPTALHNYLKAFVKLGLARAEGDPADLRLTLYVPRADVVLQYAKTSTTT